MSKDLKFNPANTVFPQITDGTHDSPKQVESGKPLITSKHIQGRHIDFETAYLISFDDFTAINKRSQVYQWDVIISMIGEYCGYCYVERNQDIDYAIKNVGVFRAETQLNAEWLYYYLNSPIGKAHLTKIRGGSSQPYLSLGGLRSLPILVPTSDNTKEKIVSVLSTLDAKVELNNRINEELEGLAKLLYDYWFVQFDFPISAAQAAAMGDPALEGKPYRQSGGKMVFNQTLKREIPEGWKVCSLGDVCENVRDAVDPSEIPVDTPQVGLEHVPRRRFILDRWGTCEKVTSLKSRFQNGDILFGKLRPYFHKVVRVAMNGVCTSELLVIRAKKPKHIGISGALLFSDIFVKFTSNQWGGSKMPRASWNSMKEYPFACPNDGLLDLFNAKVLPLWKSGGLNQQQNQQLTELRDWLLPMLMNGQVTVGDAS